MKLHLHFPHIFMMSSLLSTVTTLPLKNQVVWNVSLWKIMVDASSVFLDSSTLKMMAQWSFTLLAPGHTVISQKTSVFSNTTWRTTNLTTLPLPFTTRVQHTFFFVIIRHHSLFMMVDINLFHSQTNNNLTHFLKNYFRNCHLTGILKNTISIKTCNFQYNISQFTLFTFYKVKYKL